MKRRMFAVLMGVAVASLAAAQQPNLTNAELERSSGASLASTVQALVTAQGGPGWIGYAVPLVDGTRQICCSTDGQGGSCRLEAGEATWSQRDRRVEADRVLIDGSGRLTVLYRVERGRVQRIRMFSEDCVIDAGGRRIHWLTDVPADQSVTLLASFVTSTAGDDDRPRRLARTATSAIAMHDSAAADAALERFVATTQPLRLRKHAAFWLGNARGVSVSPC